MAFKMKGPSLYSSPLKADRGERAKAVNARLENDQAEGGVDNTVEEKNRAKKDQTYNTVTTNNKKSKKELRKDANTIDNANNKGGVGNKIKNFVTSKRKLRSKVTANDLRNNKVRTKAMDTKTLKSLGGDKYTGVQ
tara:strand:+ start:26 stop:433 length:408 start_codon:yes stop_codon:yes gene_type:complete